MSHHLSGPNLRSPREDARLDLTDTFVFTGADNESTVLIMNVNPDFGGMADAFHPDAAYQINVDTDGDNRADVMFTLEFSRPQDGGQSFTLKRADGAEAGTMGSVQGKVLYEGKVGDGVSTAADGTKVFVGPRSDPFFADLEGIQADFQWTGRDTMAEANVFSMALDVPSGELGGDSAIGVWCRVSLISADGVTSIDRGAHPSLTAYFNDDNDVKDAYNAGDPADDWGTYLEPWTAVLAHTGGYSTQDAEETLRTVLPDVLRFDRSRPAAYPSGRTLTDDVTSARLAMVSGGKITSDHIGPHTDLLNDFPYLGAPHRK